MKILFINTFYAPITFGGAERSVQLLAEELVLSGHEVRVITTATDSLASFDIINGVHVTRVKQPNLYTWDGTKRNPFEKVAWHVIDSFIDSCMIDFPSLLLNWTPDIINTNSMAGFGASSFASLGQMNKPVIQTLRDYYFLCRKSTLYNRSNSCERLCAMCEVIGKKRQGFLKAATRGLIAISPLIAEIHHSFLPWTHIIPTKIIPNGISLNCETAAQPPRQLDSSKSDLTFGFLGRLSSEKGILEVLQAMQSKPQTSINVRLIVAGDGPLLPILTSANAKHEGVTFLGKVKSAILFSKIDLLIVPSRWNEPFGRVVIEAWNAGIPVICSHSVGAGSYIQNNVDGLIFNGSLDFTEGFLQACINLVNTPNLRRLCKEKAEKFDIKSITKRTVDFFEEISSSNCL